MAQSTSVLSYRYGTFSELQTPVLKRLIVIVMVIAWLLVMADTRRIDSVSFSLRILLLGASGVSLWLATLNYVAGSAGLITGLSLFLLGELWLYPGTPFMYGLPLAIMITVLLVGQRAALLVAVVYTGAIGLRYGLAVWGTPVNTPAIALAQIWLIVLLFAQGMLPLYRLIDWSWNSHQSSLRHMEELRERRAELTKTLQQLDLAYHQLENLNAKLAQSKQTAEEERRLKAEFAANISHELRTPINMIIGFAEMMLESPRNYAPRGLPPALLTDLDVVYRNARHLSQLIDDILDMSQIAANRVVLSRTVQSLEQPLAEALAQVRPLFDSKGLGIHCRLPDRWPALAFDPVRVRQVLLNILSNAARFTSQGSIHINIELRQDDILVWVADTGPGMTAEVLSRVFEPFYQGDSTPRRRNDGTGLGLAISREIIRLHGGRMWAESQVGQGTTVYFTLPVDDQSAYAQLLPAARTAGAPAPRPERHLVADHGADNLLRHLRRSSLWSQVSVAADAQQAFGLASQAPTDAILLGTPTVEDGQQLLAQAVARDDDTPVIICHLPSLAAQYPQVRLLSRLVKPVLRSDLQEVLAMVPDASRLLLIDDDPDMLRLLARWLKLAGRPYEVWPTCSGAEALNLLASRKPDLIFLDLVMAGMDGYAVLDYLSNRPDLRGIPVAVLSARDPYDDGERRPRSIIGVTVGGGLSVEQMVSCAEALSAALRTRPRPTDPAEPTAPRA